MSFDARIHSKQYFHIIHVEFRKKNNYKLSKNSKKRIIKKFAKDNKLIYAFFLDIA